MRMESYGTANSFYRVDDDITSSTTYEFCKYTITTKTGVELSSGLIKAKFGNITPVSGDGTITFKYLANEIIPLNLLKYANDDGDGPVGTLVTKPNKPPFWVNDKGVELPIYLPSKTQKMEFYSSKSRSRRSMPW